MQDFKEILSDSDDSDDEELYPLEGKYVDEHDRQRSVGLFFLLLTFTNWPRLLSLSEFEREDIIAKRLEEKDKRNQSQKLSEFFAANQADSVSNAAKRQHTARGATKEKDRKLNELKAKRKAKADTKHVCQIICSPSTITSLSLLPNAIVPLRPWTWKPMTKKRKVKSASLIKMTTLPITMVA